MTSINTVIKNDGSVADYDAEKVNKAPMWASEGLDCSPSSIVMAAAPSFTEGMTTRELHEQLIDGAASLISLRRPDYQIAAARLGFFLLRKVLFGSFEVPHIRDLATSMAERGLYDKNIVETFTEHEWEQMEEEIDHSLDMNLPYSAFRVWKDKYLLQNRTTDEVFETPQQAYMMIAATFFHRWNFGNIPRINLIRRFYRAIAGKKLSLPTPIMSGLRTPKWMFSSCVKITGQDTLDSINAVANSVSKYAAGRAGIGFNIGSVRAVKSEVRGGEVAHTGIIPFTQQIVSSLKAVHQGGVRDASSTCFFPLWHYEIESILMLKNNRGVAENRERRTDYGIQFNDYLYDRLKKGENITVFSPHEVPGLYEAFFQDQALFKELYERYEQDESIRKKSINAADLFTTYCGERASTGRIYLMNVHHFNTNTPFDTTVAPIYQSNLCMEIGLPTKPLVAPERPDEGEIALCTLAAFNLTEIHDLAEFEELSELAVWALDSLLSFQEYPMEAGRKGGEDRRALGVGVTGYATWLARQNLHYADGSCLKPTHQLFEHMQYHLIRASMELSKVSEPCKLFHETTWAKGVMPIDRYCKKVDELVAPEYDMDWDTLRKDVMEYGMRNSTLSALMPCETSSAATGSTNGIDLPQQLVTIKTSKTKPFAVVAPGAREFGSQYDLRWNSKNNAAFLKNICVMQKFVCQSISASTSYNPDNQPNGKVSSQLMLKEIMLFNSYGGKSLYYHNTRNLAEDDTFDVDGELAHVEEESDGCAGGACKI